MDERAWADGRPLHNEVAELNAQVVVLTRRLDNRMKAGKRQAARAGFESLSTGCQAALQFGGQSRERDRDMPIFGENRRPNLRTDGLVFPTRTKSRSRPAA
jgi:hypothetical protein